MQICPSRELGVGERHRVEAKPDCRKKLAIQLMHRAAFADPHARAVFVAKLARRAHLRTPRRYIQDLGVPKLRESS